MNDAEKLSDKELIEALWGVQNPPQNLRDELDWRVHLAMIGPRERAIAFFQMTADIGERLNRERGIL